jgi:hypothetical protein
LAAKVNIYIDLIKSTGYCLHNLILLYRNKTQNTAGRNQARHKRAGDAGDRKRFLQLEKEAKNTPKCPKTFFEALSAVSSLMSPI